MICGNIRDFADSHVLHEEINSKRMKYSSASRLNESQSAFFEVSEGAIERFWEVNFE